MELEISISKKFPRKADSAQTNFEKYCCGCAELCLKKTSLPGDSYHKVVFENCSKD